MMKGIFISLLTLVAQQGLAQVSPREIEASVNRIDVSCKNCEDSGGKISYCEFVRNTALDSILNVVYKELRKEMDAASFGKLRDEQREWLKQRDDNNSANTAKMDKGDGGNATDRALVIVKSDSDFLEKRIVYLTKKIK